MNEQHVAAPTKWQDEVFDLLNLLWSERLARCVVEAKSIGSNERSLLLRALTDDLSKRPMQEVRRGVIATR